MRDEPKNVREKLLSGPINVDILNSNNSKMRMEWNPPGSGAKTLVFDYDHLLFECAVCGRTESLANVLEQSGGRIEIPKSVKIRIEVDHSNDIDGNVGWLDMDVVCSDACAGKKKYLRVD